MSLKLPLAGSEGYAVSLLSGCFLKKPFTLHKLFYIYGDISFANQI